MPSGFRNKTFFMAHIISAQKQYIADAEEMQVYEGIFGFFLRKTSAYQVWHCFYLVAVLDRSAYSYCSRSFSNTYFFQQAVRMLLVNVLFPVVSNINKR